MLTQNKLIYMNNVIYFLELYKNVLKLYLNVVGQRYVNMKLSFTFR